MKKIILSLFLLSFANLIFSQQLFFQNIVGEGFYINDRFEYEYDIKQDTLNPKYVWKLLSYEQIDNKISFSFIDNTSDTLSFSGIFKKDKDSESTMTYEERIYTHTNYGMEKLTSLVSVVVDNYYYDKTENVILITFVKLDDKKRKNR